MAVSIYLSVITLNVNGLNTPIKRCKVIKWLKKQDSSTCCLQETYLRSKDTHKAESVRMKKIIHTYVKVRKAGVATLISDKIDFKRKTVTKEKEGHYIMIKGSIQQVDITFINIYVPKIGVPKFVKQY